MRCKSLTVSGPVHCKWARRLSRRLARRTADDESFVIGDIGGVVLDRPAVSLIPMHHSFSTSRRPQLRRDFANRAELPATSRCRISASRQELRCPTKPAVLEGDHHRSLKFMRSRLAYVRKRLSDGYDCDDLSPIMAGQNCGTFSIADCSSHISPISRPAPRVTGVTEPQY